MHPVRILRRQNLLPPALQRRGRRAAVLRRDLQRPAEMFPGMLEPDAQAVMTADFVIERADMRELLDQLRRGFGSAGFEPASDLARQPRLPLRAAPDHHGIGA